MSALSRSRASVFIATSEPPHRASTVPNACRSPTEQALSASIAERSQRFLASGLGVGQERLEVGIAPDRVEGGGDGQGGRGVVALDDRATHLAKPALVIARVAEQPTRLEDGLRVIH